MRVCDAEAGSLRILFGMVEIKNPLWVEKYTPYGYIGKSYIAAPGIGGR